MKNDHKYGGIRKSRFPASLFAIYMLVLLLMAGVHTGLIVLMNKAEWNQLAQVITPMLYWGLVAVGLTLFTRKKMKDTYEEPLHRLAEATQRVADGDFSVYVPALHTADKLDYLDVMILDFNKMVEELGSIETLKTDFASYVLGTLGVAIGVRVMVSGDWTATFHFTLMPLVICTPILIIFAILIPYICFKNLEKQSIVERLRATD